MTASPMAATDQAYRAQQIANGEDPDSEVLLLEDRLAVLFVESHPELRYCAPWGAWYRFDGVIWNKDSDLAAFDLCRDYLRTKKWSADRSKVIAAKAATIAAVERLSRSDRRVVAAPDQWDSDPMLLGTPGGTVDLVSQETRPSKQEDYITKITSVAPDGDCPRWRQMLGEITNYDVGLIDYLQRIVGYALTGLVHEHVVPYMKGTGANGKSTFLNTIIRILGDYAVAAPSETFTEQYGQSHPTDLAMLRGARLVTVQELEEGKRWATARLKALTGGDPITARFMRQDFFTFTPTFKLFFGANHIPSVRYVDEATRRRIHVIPFNVTIPEGDRDPELLSKLENEYPGILAWAIEGTRAYLGSGLSPPPAVLEASAEYFDNQDDLSMWIEDCCEVGDGKWDNTTTLFSSWRRWAESAELSPGTQKQFGDRLISHRFERKKDGVKGRYWNGIALKVQKSDACDGPKD